MAKRSSPVYKGYGPQAPPETLFKPYDLGNGNDASIAQTQNAMDAAAQGYQKAYATKSFANAHPILGGLAGLALMGPAGLLMPMVAKRNDMQRQADTYAAWQDFEKNALANQESMDKLQGPRNYRNWANSTIQQGQDLGQINPNAQNLDANSYYRPEDIKAITEGTFAPAGLGLNDAIINNQQQQSFGMPGQLPPMATGEIKQPTNKPLPPVGNPGDTQPIQMDDGTGGALQAGISRTIKDISPAYDPSQLPLFMPNDVINNIQGNQASVANNSLDEGQKRYQFDQEAPKRAAEIEKLQAEVTKALADGDLSKAKAAYTRLQTKLLPALTQSEINRNNRPPAGRAPNALEMMTPEQRVKYLQRLAEGKGDTYSPSDAMGEAKLEFYANDPSVPPAMRQAAGSALTRLRGGNPSAPAAAPRGGGTMTTLSSGRKVKL